MENELDPAKDLAVAITKAFGLTFDETSSGYLERGEKPYPWLSIEPHHFRILTGWEKILKLYALLSDWNKLHLDAEWAILPLAREFDSKPPAQFLLRPMEGNPKRRSSVLCFLWDQTSQLAAYITANHNANLYRGLPNRTEDTIAGMPIPKLNLDAYFPLPQDEEPGKDTVLVF